MFSISLSYYPDLRAFKVRPIPYGTHLKQESILNIILRPPAINLCLPASGGLSVSASLPPEIFFFIYGRYTNLWYNNVNGNPQKLTSSTTKPFFSNRPTIPSLLYLLR